MNKLIFLLLSVFLILIQCFVIDNMVLKGAIGRYISTELYIYILITIPFTFGHINTMIVAFVLGIVLDIISGSLGVHAASLVPIAYVRPFFLSSMASREEREKCLFLNLSLMGRSTYISYAGIMILSYHTLYLCLESFQILQPWLLLKILLSSVVTLFLIVLFQKIPFSIKLNGG